MPFFSGSSYLLHPSINQLTEISLSLHPSSSNGLILFAQSNEDHFSLGLHNGFAVFQLSVGSIDFNIVSAVSLGLDDWHMITIGVNSTTSYITINNTHTSSFDMNMSAVVFDSPLLVGSVVSPIAPLPSSVMATSGFIGCIRDLQVNSATVDIVMDALAGQGVSSCPEPVCSYVQCQNGGNCSVTEGGSGFMCHCPHGFGGTFCETLLPLCSPNPCLFGGQCEEYGDRMFTCRCPLLRAGRVCEEG